MYANRPGPNKVRVSDVDIVGAEDRDRPSNTSVYDRVTNFAVATLGAFPSNGSFISVLLRAIVDLNVVEDDLAFSPGTIRLKVIADHDLTTPAVSVLSTNLDVSVEKDYFASHVNAVVLVLSRRRRAPMIILQRCVQSYQTTLDGCDDFVV